MDWFTQLVKGDKLHNFENDCAIKLGGHGKVHTTGRGSHESSVNKLIKTIKKSNGVRPHDNFGKAIRTLQELRKKRLNTYGDMKRKGETIKEFTVSVEDCDGQSRKTDNTEAQSGRTSRHEVGSRFIAVLYGRSSASASTDDIMSDNAIDALFC